MHIAVIIPAAGTGARFGGAQEGQPVSSKVEVRLAGRPIFMHAIDCFKHCDHVGQIILAVHPEILERFRVSHGDQLTFLGVELVAGGTVDRWQTVKRALTYVEDQVTHMMVHDAARPLADRKLIERLVAAAHQHDAVIPVMPVNATLKRIGPEYGSAETDSTDPLDAILGDAGRPEVTGRPVVETLDRRDVVEVQTPQIFRADLLRRAYASIEGQAPETVKVTDDAGLVEQLGETVMTIPGAVNNMKITHPDDLKLAEAIAALGEKERAANEGRRRLFETDDE